MSPRGVITPKFRDLRNAVSFLFRIGTTETFYSLSVGPKSDTVDLGHEHLRLELEATCLAPKKHAGATVSFVLMGNDFLISNDLEAGHPVGSLTIRGKSGQYFGDVPRRSLMWLIDRIDSGRVRYVHIIADPLFRGSAKAHVLDFDETYSSEDFPGAAADAP